MLKTVLLLYHATVLLLALTAPAHAGPIFAGVAAFMATPIGQLVVGIGLSFVSSAIKSLFGSKQAQKVTGTQLTVRLGGDGPFSFPLGPAATAGTKFYVGSWGNSGGAPNAYYVEAFAVSDLAVAGFKGWWVNDQKAVFGAYDATLGYPVLDFRRGGKDHVWIKYYTGSQTAPDGYLRAKFGSNSAYPYDADMVGRGVAYFIVTTLRPGPDDQDLLSGPVRVLAELDSIPLYDPRKDSSVGGSGSHRWGQVNTYQPSANLMVQAYNVARGISYDGEWVFGGQNWPAFRLPLSSWMAAMNACDLAIGLKGGGTEPQFHGGGMVDVSETDPASLLNELLKSASAKIAEAGGVYKVRVGAPGIPVMAFSDADIVVTREHGWTPFRGNGETFNTVNWTYSEPQERWANKPGPQYKDGALVTADRGRSLPMAFDVPWTQSNTTGQRLAQAALKNSRRFDTHVFYMPPIAWLLEALDTVSWTSVQAGYEAKAFEVDEMAGGSDLIQFVSIRENDPSDYDWTPADDELAYAIAPLLTIRPPAQIVSGVWVEPAYGQDSEGRNRQGGYTVHWDSTAVAVDVDFVRIAHRLAGETAERWVGLIPKPNLLEGAASVFAALIGGETFEVQVHYLAGSARRVEASGWLSVEIPRIGIAPEDLTDEVNDARAWASRTIEEIQADRSRAIAQMANGLADRMVDMQTMRTEITARFETTEQEITASYMHEVNVVAGELGSLVDRTELLEASVFDPVSGLGATATALDSFRVSVTDEFEATSEAITAVESSIGLIMAGGYISIQAVAAPSGWDVRAAFAIKGTSGGAFVQVGLYMDAKSDGTSRIVLDADETVFTGKARSVSGLSYLDFTNGALRIAG